MRRKSALILQFKNEGASWSIVGKLALIGALLLIFQIPAFFVSRMAQERHSQRDAVVGDVTKKWGDSPLVAGPVLSIPWLDRKVSPRRGEKPSLTYAHFLPEHLRVEGKIEPEMRRRGSVEIPLYTTRLKVTGNFVAPDLSEWQPFLHDIHWDQAVVTVGIGEAAALRDSVTLNWDEAEIEFSAGSEGISFLPAGIHARLVDGRGLRTNSHAFSFELALRGSKALSFLPLGARTEIMLNSSWRTPTFTGAYLPAAVTWTEEGFRSEWRVLNFARSYPQRWREGEVQMGKLSDSQFGVGLLVSTDPYLLAFRSTKFQLLATGLVFLLFFAFEQRYRIKVHPIQYLMVGASQVLFFLLLFSLSEYLSFWAAYLLCSLTIVGAVVGFCRAVFRKWRPAQLMAGALGVLYLCLFPLLYLTGAVLLVGSLGLFSVLLLAMYLTRNFVWYTAHEAAYRHRPRETRHAIRRKAAS